MTEAGKGDTPRPVDGDEYRRNYERIFPPSVAMADELMGIFGYSRATEEDDKPDGEE